MIRYIIYTVVISFLLYLGNLRITLYPFSISMENWKSSLGILLIFIGFLLVGIDIHLDGYKEGSEDMIKELVEKSKELTPEKLNK